MTFREHWRNGTLGLGMLAAAAVVVLALALWFRGPGAATSQAKYEYHLSHDAIVLAGTRERLFALERWQAPASQPAGASVNLLIVNSDDASSRWMFPYNGQTILIRDELHGGDTAAYAPVTGLVLTVAAGERQSLYYYRVGGGPAVRFLTAESIIAADQAAAERYLVIYRNGARTTAAVYSLVDFRAVSERNTPEIPP